MISNVTVCLVGSGGKVEALCASMQPGIMTARGTSVNLTLNILRSMKHLDTQGGVTLGVEYKTQRGYKLKGKPLGRFCLVF